MPCEASVIVPVKNEARRLVRALTALAGQTQMDGRPFAYRRYEVLVPANNCRDESAALARMVARQDPGFRLRVLEVELEGDQACAGFGRKRLRDEACRRLSRSIRYLSARTPFSRRLSPSAGRSTNGVIRKAMQAQTRSGKNSRCEQPFASAKVADAHDPEIGEPFERLGRPARRVQ